MDQNVGYESWVKIDEASKYQYMKACYQAGRSTLLFEEFRKHPVISMVVENSTEAKMKQTWKYLNEHRRWIVSTPRMREFVKSEKVGGPTVYPIPKKRGFYWLSPTTMRYILTVHYLYRFVGLYTENMRIVEIGAGYGGLCKIIHDLIQPSSYIIYDLPEVRPLQQHFLSRFNIECEFREQGQPLDRADLVISWCAWTELTNLSKQLYLDTVIRNSRRCLIGCNYNCVENKELMASVKPNVESYVDELDYPILYF